MQKVHRSISKAAGALALSAAWLVAVPAHAEPIVGLLTEADNTGNALITFDSATPGLSTAPVVLTGLMGDTRLVGIDLRPTTGLLYGVGNAGGLYTINPLSALATMVGSLSVALNSMASSFGVDFNLVPDLAGMASLRITNDAGQNLRANVNAGLIGVTVADTNLNGAATGLFASAYTNNDLDPATATALFGIGRTNPNASGLSLYRQNPANDGTLALVGNLGILETDTEVGFDVSSTGATFASLSPQPRGPFGLYGIDLSNGAANLIGAFATFAGYRGVTDIAALTAPIAPPVAAIPEPETYALMLAGLAGLAAVARRRRARKAD